MRSSVSFLVKRKSSVNSAGTVSCSPTVKSSSESTLAGIVSLRCRVKERKVFLSPPSILDGFFSLSSWASTKLFWVFESLCTVVFRALLTGWGMMRLMLLVPSAA